MGAETTNDNGIAIENGDEDDDNRIKKELLIETIAQNCASSSHQVLQKINHAINEAGDGSKLIAIVLSGGVTNYSYKVFVDKHPELAIFAKLCFERAGWNPDAHYDLKRTDNECDIMKKMSVHAPDCVVAPLALLDVEREGEKMKVLVTEWSKADEQFGNQFIDGTVDLRIAPKMASTLAALHSIEDYDPGFNAQVNDSVLNMFEQIKYVQKENSKKQNPKDRTEAYSASVGEEVLVKSIDALIEDCSRRECLIHSDSHVFNTLVEAKPSIEELENFGPNGTVVLCDWEMAYVGPAGKDVGLPMSFPIACMIAHALNGQLDAKDSILAYINGFLDSYIGKAIESGKTEEEAAAIVRKGISWCGWYTHSAIYVMGIQDTFPTESAEQKAYVQDAMGVLGLKLGRIGFDTDYVPATATAQEVRAVFASLVEEEVARAAEVFHSGRRKKQPRKSSMLRATSRRFSDAAMYGADSVRKLSASAMSARHLALVEDLEE